MYRLLLYQLLDIFVSIQPIVFYVLFEFTDVDYQPANPRDASHCVVIIVDEHDFIEITKLGGIQFLDDFVRNRSFLQNFTGIRIDVGDRDPLDFRHWAKFRINSLLRLQFGVVRIQHLLFACVTQLVGFALRLLQVLLNLLVVQHVDAGNCRLLCATNT